MSTRWWADVRTVDSCSVKARIGWNVCWRSPNSWFSRSCACMFRLDGRAGGAYPLIPPAQAEDHAPRQNRGARSCPGMARKYRQAPPYGPIGTFRSASVPINRWRVSGRPLRQSMARLHATTAHAQPRTMLLRWKVVITTEVASFLFH